MSGTIGNDNFRCKLVHVTSMIESMTINANSNVGGGGTSSTAVLIQGGNLMIDKGLSIFAALLTDGSGVSFSNTAITSDTFNLVVDGGVVAGQQVGFFAENLDLTTNSFSAVVTMAATAGQTGNCIGTIITLSNFRLTGISHMLTSNGCGSTTLNPLAQNNHGIVLTSSAFVVNGLVNPGLLTISGTSGLLAADSHGVMLEGSSFNSVDNSEITVSGIATGAGQGDSNVGLVSNGFSASGPLLLNLEGSATGSPSTHGIVVDGGSAAGTVSIASSVSAVLIGSAGSSGTSETHGVFVASTITFDISGSSIVSLNGAGGMQSGFGVLFDGGIVLDDSTLTMDGIGGMATGGSGNGVVLSGAPKLLTSGMLVLIGNAGQFPASSNNIGLRIEADLTGGALLDAMGFGGGAGTDLNAVGNDGTVVTSIISMDTVSITGTTGSGSNAVGAHFTSSSAVVSTTSNPFELRGVSSTVGFSCTGIVYEGGLDVTGGVSMEGSTNSLDIDSDGTRLFNPGPTLVWTIGSTSSIFSSVS